VLLDRASGNRPNGVASVSWYDFLLFVHVACAVIWLGGGFALQIYAMIERSSGDDAAMARFAGNAARIGDRVFIPAALIVVLAGIGLMIEGSWSWGQLWIVFSLLTYACSFLVGVTVLAPTAKKIEAVGPQTPEGQRLMARIFSVLRVDLLFLFAIVFAMTVKPTSDDLALVVVAALILVAGSAFFLRDLAKPATG
jgi:uncharacterized membrane protein